MGGMAGLAPLDLPMTYIEGMGLHFSLAMFFNRHSNVTCRAANNRYLPTCESYDVSEERKSDDETDQQSAWHGAHICVILKTYDTVLCKVPNLNLVYRTVSLLGNRSTL